MQVEPRLLSSKNFNGYRLNLQHIQNLHFPLEHKPGQFAIPNNVFAYSPLSMFSKCANQLLISSDGRFGGAIPAHHLELFYFDAQLSLICVLFDSNSFLYARFPPQSTQQPICLAANQVLLRLPTNNLKEGGKCETAARLPPSIRILPHDGVSQMMEGGEEEFSRIALVCDGRNALHVVRIVTPNSSHANCESAAPSSKILFSHKLSEHHETSSKSGGEAGKKIDGKDDVEAPLILAHLLDVAVFPREAQDGSPLLRIECLLMKYEEAARDAASSANHANVSRRRQLHWLSFCIGSDNSQSSSLRPEQTKREEENGEGWEVEAEEDEEQRNQGGTCWLERERRFCVPNKQTEIEFAAFKKTRNDNKENRVERDEKAEEEEQREEELIGISLVGVEETSSGEILHACFDSLQKEGETKMREESQQDSQEKDASKWVIIGEQHEQPISGGAAGAIERESGELEAQDVEFDKDCVALDPIIDDEEAELDDGASSASNQNSRRKMFCAFVSPACCSSTNQQQFFLCKKKELDRKFSHWLFNLPPPPPQSFSRNADDATDGDVNSSFSSSTSFSSSPLCCLRFGVDALLFSTSQQEEEEGAHTRWLKHVASMPAFGYVIASKQHGQMIACAPPTNQGEVRFVAFCDMHGRTHIYFSPRPLRNPDCKLTRRRVEANGLGENNCVGDKEEEFASENGGMGRSSDVAEQFVVELFSAGKRRSGFRDEADGRGEAVSSSTSRSERILGISASTRIIFVLSNVALYALDLDAVI